MAIGIAFIVAAAVMIFAIRGLVAEVVGVACAVFFGGGTVVMLVQFLRRLPLLVLSRDGLTDKGSLISFGFLPWSELEEARIHTVQIPKPYGGRPNTQTFVKVPFTNTTKALSGFPRWKQWVLRQNAKAGSHEGAGPEWTSNLLPMTAKDLVDLINDWRESSSST